MFQLLEVQSNTICRIGEELFGEQVSSESALRRFEMRDVRSPEVVALGRAALRRLVPGWP